MRSGQRKKRTVSLLRFASDFRLLRAFVIGRLKRLEEINPPSEECVRAVCDLLSDAVAASWNKRVLRAIGYSVRSLGTDMLVEFLRKAVKVMINRIPSLMSQISLFPNSSQAQCSGFARPASGMPSLSVSRRLVPGSSGRNSITRGQDCGNILLLTKVDWLDRDV